MGQFVVQGVDDISKAVVLSYYPCSGIGSCIRGFTSFVIYLSLV